MSNWCLAFLIVGWVAGNAFGYREGVRLGRLESRIDALGERIEREGKP